MYTTHKQLFCISHDRGGTGGVQEAVHRTLEEIRALIGGTAWAKFIPDDRADPLWVDLRTDLGLTGLEVASFKKYYYMPEDIKKGKHRRT